LDYPAMREVAYSLFSSLYYLHEGLQLIHTDLKPENILFTDVDDETSTTNTENLNKSSKEFCSPKSSQVVIIDLGSATFEYEDHSSIISTRHYRAPEVVLQVGWSYPSDVWSLGCILLELYTGKTVFQTHQNLEHLAMMEAILGPISSDWLREYRDDNKSAVPIYSGPINKTSKEWVIKYPSPDTSSESIKRVKSMKKLKEIIKEEHKDFYTLMERILDFNPKTRITAEEALNHSFFDCLREKFQPSSNNKKGGEIIIDEPRSNDLTISSISTSRSTDYS